MQRAFEAVTAADQEGDVVVSPLVEDVVLGGDQLAVGIHVVLREVGPDVEVVAEGEGVVEGVGVAGCAGFGDQGTGDWVPGAEVGEVGCGFGWEDEEVCLDVAWC